MENNGLGPDNLISHATGKYWVQYYGCQTFQGKNYHSFLVLRKIRNYWQQVESGLNYSDLILQEYMDELV